MAPHADDSRFAPGRVCLDLLGTAHPRDLLGTADSLRVWCAAAGLVPDGTPLDAADRRWLIAFRDLRGQIAVLVRGELAGRPVPAALDRVNAVARPAPPAPRAVRAADGSLARALDAAPGLDALLAVVARDAVDLLTDPVARGRLRQCAGVRCPRIYLDTSRGGRRRWCSSEVCGNRERVARHRRRSHPSRA
ncbi:CGNR zinc finger domain-containing protein [Streptomyces uncialis]|uniref:CGNR zinc finger domain-containing protein n=1 Tax=Streptomyces uncialis TaxID=1048205 RepID=UPI00340A9583